MDVRTARRVAALRRLAAGTCFPDEAVAAAAKADALEAAAAAAPPAGIPPVRPAVAGAPWPEQPRFWTVVTSTGNTSSTTFYATWIV